MKAASYLLIRSLRLNAGFSGLSAVLMLVSANWIAGQLGLSGPASVYAVAVFLLVFAAQLWNICRTGIIRDWEIVGIIAGDLLWVVASFVLAAIYYESISTVGLLLVDAVALVVLVLAIMQIRGLRQFRRAAYS